MVNKVESALTLSQVSRLLDIPEEMVKQWSDDGIIRFYFNSSNGEKLFRLREVARFLNILKANQCD